MPARARPRRTSLPGVLQNSVAWLATIMTGCLAAASIAAAQRTDPELGMGMCTGSGVTSGVWSNAPENRFRIL